MNFQRLKKLLNASKLALNIDKTNYLILHSLTMKFTEPLVLKFGHKKISQTDYVKFLVVLLDETLG